MSMIKRGIAGAVVGGLILGACGSFGTSTPPAPAPNPAPVISQMTFAEEVVAACLTACLFVPEAQSVISLLNAVPWVGTVSAAVGVICEAFVKWEAANGAVMATAPGAPPKAKAIKFPLTLTPPNGGAPISLEVSGTAFPKGAR